MIISYRKWLEQVPSQISDDVLWKHTVYRYSLFLADISWHDRDKIIRKKKNFSLADQLHRSAGSISANISEGYSRNSQADKLRFYEYALGSAREARGWYYQAKLVFSKQDLEFRLELLSQIIKLLLNIIHSVRKNHLSEYLTRYTTDTSKKRWQTTKIIL